jgi:hypothetical protein
MPISEELSRSKCIPQLRAMRFDDYESVRRLATDNALLFPDAEDWRRLWLDNPLWKLKRGMPIGWVLETSTGEIVGSLESLPTLYSYKGANFAAAVARAWCVDAPFRGFALQLLDEYFAQSLDLFINANANAEAALVLGELSERVPVGRWDVFSFCVTHHRLCMKRMLEKWHVPLSELLAYPAGALLFLKDMASRQRLPDAQRSLTIENAQRFDERFDVFWKELIRQNPEKVLAERNSSALSWRFGIALRSGRLHILTASKGDLMRAYCVLKRLDGAAGQRRMRIADFQSLEPGTDVLASLLRAAIRICAAEDVYILENIGAGVPKMRAFDAYARYWRRLSSWLFFYRAESDELATALARPSTWDPSSFDGEDGF